MRILMLNDSVLLHTALSDTEHIFNAVYYSELQ